MRKPLTAGAAAALILSSLSWPASADTLTIVGGGISGNVSISGDTALWSLLGGVTTSTPAGDNGKNAILRYYVVASGSNGSSVFSLGELNPTFGGTNTAPFVSTSGGSLSLVDPNTGASGRGCVQPDEFTRLCGRGDADRAWRSVVQCAAFGPGE